ncbi:MAG: flagellar hook-basal body complex protein FliE [Eubacteriales bacterium]
MFSNVTFGSIDPILTNQDLSVFETEATDENGASFMDLFSTAVQNVRDTEETKNQFQYLLSVGELDNPAELTIAESKAQTAVDLLVQLRNKALEAHTAVMAIQI